MSQQSEHRAAQLFDEYIEQARKGQPQPVEHYLGRCPEVEREGLREALEGIAYLLEHNYDCPPAKPATVNRIMEEIQAVRKRRQVLPAARARAAAVKTDPGTLIRDPPEYLRQMLNLSVALQAAGTGQAVAQPAVVRYRGRGTPTPRNRWSIDDAFLRALEGRIAPQAEAVLARTQQTTAPVDAAAVADALGLFVQEAHLDDMDGCLVTDGTVGGILINKQIGDPRRRRFTLAHEIGHFALHRDRITVRPECVDEVGSFFQDQEEKEANAFAGSLLMPPFLLPENIGRVSPTLDQADELVEQFDVSFAAALRHLVRESHWGCALVVTCESVVEWAVRSQYFEAFIPTGKRPHQDTMAVLLLRTDGPEQDENDVPAHAWVEGSLAESGAEVREESRRLENGYVYSLLTLLEEE